MYKVEITKRETWNGVDRTFTLNEVDVNSDKRIYNATITQEINAIHGFNFTVNIMHPHYKEIVQKITRIKVTFVRKSTGETIEAFNGYVSKIQEHMDNSGRFCKTVVCESALGYLHDSVQTYVQRTGEFETFRGFIQTMITTHNRDVNTFACIDVGTLVHNAPMYNSWTIQYGSSYDVLAYISERWGGEFRIRANPNQNGNPYLFDYNENRIIDSANKIEIKLAKNLQSLDSFVDGTQIVTRLYPFGPKQINSSTGEELGTRRNIKSVNGDCDFLLASTDALGKYGHISAIEIFEDPNDRSYPTPTQLKELGQRSLDARNAITKNYKITALDLSTIGLDVEEFSLGGICRLINPVMGIDEDIRVTKLTLDLDNPQRSCIEVGGMPQPISSLKGAI